jgi:GNAT superfamily N-acetyltransferase
MAPSEKAPAPLPPGLAARPLTEADIAAALLLSEEAGWNQVAADWRIFVELGSAVGVTREDGRLIATAATLPYGGRFAWISMVLVTTQHRRHGLATWLLRHCIATLLDQGLVPVLDATPAGRTVYLGLDFHDTWSLHRLVARATGPAGGDEALPDLTVRPLEPGDWPALAAYDGRVFGADRGPLLQHLAERLPTAALVAERHGKLAGFLLGRDGRVMTQLGPLAAEDDAIARALLRRAITSVTVPVAIDLPDRHRALDDWLIGLGFVTERPWTRMVYRQDTAFDDASRLFAIAGPELG